MQELRIVIKLYRRQENRVQEAGDLDPLSPSLLFKATLVHFIRKLYIQPLLHI